VACAQDKLIPALSDADDDALVLADGFSCRTQIRGLAPGRRPMHVAQVLAQTIRAPGSMRVGGPGAAQVVDE
jgi:hypothetical protein